MTNIELIADKANSVLFLNVSQLNHVKLRLLDLGAEKTMLELIDCMIDNNRKAFNEIQRIKKFG